MRRSGFSLIELILVVGILLAMTGISAAFYSRFLLQNAVDNTVNQIVEDLHKAQIYTMAGRGNTTWGVNYASYTLSLYPVNGGTTETFSVNPNLTVTGLGDVRFAKITGEIPTATNISVSHGNISKTISVSQKGVVNK